MLSKTPVVFMQLRRFSKSVGVIGVPFSKGQPKQGTELGPSVLRESGLLDDLKLFIPSLDVYDYGDIIYKPLDGPNDVGNLKNWKHVAPCNHSLSIQVEKVIQDKRICLTLGGDHCVGIGSVDGHARALKDKQIALLWVDAHSDINTADSSETGNCHGMPLAFLVEEMRPMWKNLPGLEWQQPRLSLRNVAFIGLRSMDPFERSIISKFGVTAFGMEEVQRYGIHNVVHRALNKIDPEHNKSLHVSFDIDSLDVLEAPSTGTAVRGGLTLREGIEIMEAVHDTARLQAMDLVEVNPRIGTVADVKITVDAAKQIILAAFGHKRSGHFMPDKNE